MQDYIHITVERASRNCGAFISGIDLKQPLEDAVYREIHTAMMRHQVVFFRDQDVTPQEQAVFARKFGPLRKARRSAFEVRDDVPEVSVIVNDRERPPYIDHYHADGMFRAKPEFASMLKAEQPPEMGGDTIFVSLTAAWNGLSDTMKAALEDKIAVYDFMRLHSSPEKARNWEGESRAGTIKTRDENPPVRHPLDRVMAATRQPHNRLPEFAGIRPDRNHGQAKFRPRLSKPLLLRTIHRHSCERPRDCESDHEPR